MFVYVVSSWLHWSTNPIMNLIHLKTMATFIFHTITFILSKCSCTVAFVYGLVAY